MTDRYSLRAYGLTKILRSKYQDRYATHTSVEGLGKFQNSAPIESNAHTLLQAHKHQSSSVPQRSLLKFARLKTKCRNIHCVHHWWKRVGQPRLLEGGVRLTPYTVRQSGFILWPLTGSKKIKIGYMTRWSLIR